MTMFKDFLKLIWVSPDLISNTSVKGLQSDSFKGLKENRYPNQGAMAMIVVIVVVIIIIILLLLIIIIIIIAPHQLIG